MASSMRAAQFNRYGPPEVLHVATIPVPVPRAGEVLVRVGAATVNGGELAFRSGGLRALTGSRFPKGIGVDFAGEVARLGAGVTSVAVGERVWGVLPALQMVLARQNIGTLAEYVIVDAARLGTIPAGIADAEAAALLIGAVALVGLREQTRLVAGERLLVRGGTGGVGSLAVQLGHYLGAHVTALVGPQNLDFVRELGAAEAFDYTTTTAADLGRFDVIFDSAGSQMASYQRLLTPQGRMVTIALEPPLPALGTALASTRFGSRRIRFFSGNPQRALLTDLAGYIERGAMRAVIDSVYTLDQIADAHRAAETRGGRGKRVITIG